MVDELKEENFLCEWACDSFPLQLLEERVRRSKLAVKQPQTTLHTGSPLIFLLEYEPVERGAVGGGRKGNYCCLFICHLRRVAML